MRGLCLGGRLAVVAGRGFGFDRVLGGFVLGRLMFSREGQARAMLRRGFHPVKTKAVQIASRMRVNFDSMGGTSWRATRLSTPGPVT